MFEKFRLLVAVLRHGEELTHADTWKNRQVAASALLALLGALAPFLPFEASQEDLLAVAGGLAALGGLLNAYLVVATSRRVGLPAGGGNPYPAEPPRP
jgi:hypothetical protein